MWYQPSTTPPRSTIPQGAARYSKWASAAGKGQTFPFFARLTSSPPDLDLPARYPPPAGHRQSWPGVLRSFRPDRLGQPGGRRASAGQADRRRQESCGQRLRNRLSFTTQVHGSPTSKRRQITVFVSAGFRETTGVPVLRAARCCPDLDPGRAFELFHTGSATMLSVSWQTLRVRQPTPTTT